MRCDKGLIFGMRRGVVELGIIPAERTDADGVKARAAAYDIVVQTRFSLGWGIDVSN